MGPAHLGASALTLLREHCRPDPAHPAGWIESIYFDDPGLTSYWEKANGDLVKRKIRIRWYPSVGKDKGLRTVAAFLDVKDRLGAGRDKKHIGFEADRALLEESGLADPRLNRLLDICLPRAGFHPMPWLAPTVSIRYQRHRFVCPVTQSRICLDLKLSSPRVNTGLLPGGLPEESGLVVCEAKSPFARSWTWSPALRRMGFQHLSFSKYGHFLDVRMNRGY